jgi:hypothetical protein
MGRWDPIFGIRMTREQKNSFLERLRAGSTIGNSLVDLGIPRYTYRRELEEDPEFRDQVHLCHRYPEGVCDAMVFNRVLEGGFDMLPAAVALSRMRGGRRYQNLMMKLKYKEFGLEASALKYLKDSAKEPDFDLMRLTLDEIKELEAVNNAAMNGDELTAEQKIRWFDLVIKATPRLDGPAPKMPGGNGAPGPKARANWKAPERPQDVARRVGGRST